MNLIERRAYVAAICGQYINFEASYRSLCRIQRQVRGFTAILAGSFYGCLLGLPTAYMCRFAAILVSSSFTVT